MSRRSRMTPQLEALFREQAEVYLKRKSLKALAKITGYASSYCWVQIHHHIVKMRDSENNSVSRETNSSDTAES